MFWLLARIKEEHLENIETVVYILKNNIYQYVILVWNLTFKAREDISQCTDENDSNLVL